MTAITRVVLGGALLAVPAQAAAPFDGRWASDVGGCAGSWLAAAPVTVTALTVSWPGTSCAITRSYMAGDVWYTSARCSGEGIASAVPMQLQVRGDRLLLRWGKAAPEELRRCPLS